jgi:hypothetical protein
MGKAASLTDCNISSIFGAAFLTSEFVPSLPFLADA